MQMNFARCRKFYRSIISAAIIVCNPLCCLSQVIDSLNTSTNNVSYDTIRPSLTFSAAVGVTNNGISLVPSFSLGKPAGVVSLVLSRRRFSFEPDLFFSLKGKPWSFVFWFRYKVIDKRKFTLRVGVHPSLNFAPETVQRGGNTSEVLITQRYVAAEVVPNFQLSRSIGIGAYYLRGRGIDEETIKAGHFLGLNSTIVIRLPKELYVRLIPQIYYLRLDAVDGFYVTSAMTIGKKDFPFTISSIVNREMDTDIVSKPFVWNVSLSYFFRNEYYKKK